MNDTDKPQLSDADQKNASQPRGLMARLRQSVRFRLLMLISAAIILAAVVLTVLLSSTVQVPKNPVKTTEGSAPASSDAFMTQYGSGCQNRNVEFTSPPMKLSDINHIRPLGSVGDTHVMPTDYVYIGPANTKAADNTYPVLMPANGTVVRVDALPAVVAGDASAQKRTGEDHRVIISFSCRYFAIYIHVQKLSDKLKAAVGTLQPSQSRQISVDLRAGETVSYVGGSEFSWIPVDSYKKLSFMSPELYVSEPWKIHVVSPFDLYSGSLKSQLEAKSLREKPPVGGRIDYDLTGKLVGNWFREGTNGYQGKDQGNYWDGYLSIAPDYIDATSTIVSIGSWNGSARQFVVSGISEPTKITQETGPVKFELKKLNYVTNDNLPWNGSFVRGMHPSQNEPLEGTIMLQVLPDERLMVEKFPGMAASQVSGFTAAALTYER